MIANELCRQLRAHRLIAAVLMAAIVSGCTESPRAISDDNALPDSSEFAFRGVVAPIQITEGDTNGVVIPLTIDRRGGHTAPIDFTLSATSTGDAAFISGTFSEPEQSTNSTTTELTLRLDIADQPLLAHQRELTITASDARGQDQIAVVVNVEPVDAPDVYLLIGQSNMVGFSGDQTREAGPGQADAPHPRIFQLNVSENDQFELFQTGADFRSPALNVVPPMIVTAQDPLHVPLEQNNTEKALDYIGLGLSFAKAALDDTSRNIILVPAAWSGTSFCANDNGPIGHWNAQATDNPDLGNTWLFDRAVTRANLALAETGGILRGILWHQGESDANERCGPVYEANLERLVRQLRLRIEPDRRGAELRSPTANIPFVTGTMSRGIDDRGDLSEFSVPKQLIDMAHRNIASRVNNTAVSEHDDLTPANGFGCGNTSCIHFGDDALREMGRRYYRALREAVSR